MSYPSLWIPADSIPDGQKAVDAFPGLCFHGFMTRSRTEVSWGHLQGLWGLVFLNLILFADVLFTGGGRVLSSPQNDLYLHFAAWRQFGADTLRQGHLALWNPHYLGGSPFLGNFESALLYPSHLLYLMLPLSLALDLDLVMHVFLAGAFTYLWARHRGLSPTASFLSGATFMWGGAFYLHLYAGHLPNLTVMAWAPLVFLALDGLLERISLSWVLLGMAAVTFQVLGGHPQYTYFTAIMASIYLLLNLPSKTSKLSLLVAFLSFYAGAFLLSAAQLWPGLEALSECSRNLSMDIASAKAFSFPPENILTLILPGFFGDLTRGPYWGRWYLWEVSLFMGLVPFLFALWGSRGQKGSFTRRAWVMVAIAFVLSLGAFTPLFGLLYRWMPGFGGIRGTCKFDFVVALFLALLAGMGLDRWRKEKRFIPSAFYTVLSIGALLFIAEIILLISMEQGLDGAWAKGFSSLTWLSKTIAAMDPGPRSDYILSAGHHVAASLLSGGMVCVLMVFLLLFQRSAYIGPFAVILALAELFIFARGNRPTFPMGDLQKKFDQVRQVYRQDPGDYRIFGTGSAALASRAYDIWEDEPMVMARYGRFVCASQGIPEDRLFSTSPLFTKFGKIYRLLRLKYLASWDAGEIRLYSMPFKPLPRMFLVGDWELAPRAEEALAKLLAPGFEPSQKVLLEREPQPIPGKGLAQGKVQWKELDSDKVEISAELPKPEILLVTDNYAKGWRVEPYADSVSQGYQVMPADHFLRAIPLGAGKHHFLLRYRPWSFEVGKWVSVLSCLLFGAVFLFWRRSKHPETKRP